MVDQRQLQNTFGETLRKVRTQKSLTQEELALECELDRTFISMLERGLRQPSLTSIFTIAEALDIKPSALLKKVEQATK